MSTEGLMRFLQRLKDLMYDMLWVLMIASFIAVIVFLFLTKTILFAALTVAASLLTLQLKNIEAGLIKKAKPYSTLSYLLFYLIKPAIYFAQFYFLEDLFLGRFLALETILSAIAVLAIFLLLVAQNLVQKEKREKLEAILAIQSTWLSIKDDTSWLVDVVIITYWILLALTCIISHLYLRLPPGEELVIIAIAIFVGQEFIGMITSLYLRARMIQSEYVDDDFRNVFMTFGLANVIIFSSYTFLVIYILRTHTNFATPIPPWSVVLLSGGVFFCIYFIPYFVGSRAYNFRKRSFSEKRLEILHELVSISTIPGSASSRGALETVKQTITNFVHSLSAKNELLELRLLLDRYSIKDRHAARRLEGDEPADFKKAFKHHYFKAKGGYIFSYAACQILDNRANLDRFDLRFKELTFYETLLSYLKKDSLQVLKDYLTLQYSKTSEDAKKNAAPKNALLVILSGAVVGANGLLYKHFEDTIIHFLKI